MVRLAFRGNVINNLPRAEPQQLTGSCHRRALPQEQIFAEMYILQRQLSFLKRPFPSP